MCLCIFSKLWWPLFYSITTLRPEEVGGEAALLTAGNSLVATSQLQSSPGEHDSVTECSHQMRTLHDGDGTK